MAKEKHEFTLCTLLFFLPSLFFFFSVYRDYIAKGEERARAAELIHYDDGRSARGEMRMLSHLESNNSLKARLHFAYVTQRHSCLSKWNESYDQTKYFLMDSRIVFFDVNHSKNNAFASRIRA